VAPLSSEWIYVVLDVNPPPLQARLYQRVERDMVLSSKSAFTDKGDFKFVLSFLVGTTWEHL
jgi:hypothetical protein